MSHTIPGRCLPRSAECGTIPTVVGSCSSRFREQVRMPERVHIGARSGIYPPEPRRFCRAAPERKAGVFEEARTFAEIAAATRRHHVLPRVCPTARAGYDVVDALGRPRAVLAAVTIPRKHRVAGERHRPAVGNPDESTQSDDGRDGDLKPLRVPHLRGRLQHGRFVVQHQYRGAPGRNHR